MGALSASEQQIVERAKDADMLVQVETWAAINSGSRNIAGLDRMSGLLADAFSALPGELRLAEPARVETVDSAGILRAIEHAQHLHLTVRPDAPVQLLFTAAQVSTWTSMSAAWARSTICCSLAERAPIAPP